MPEEQRKTEATLDDVSLNVLMDMLQRSVVMKAGLYDLNMKHEALLKQIEDQQKLLALSQNEYRGALTGMATSLGLRGEVRLVPQAKKIIVAEG